MDFFLRPLIFYPKGFIIKAEMRKHEVFTGISALFKYCDSDVIIEEEMRKHEVFIGISAPYSNIA